MARLAAAPSAIFGDNHDLDYPNAMVTSTIRNNPLDLMDCVQNAIGSQPDQASLKTLYTRRRERTSSLKVLSRLTSTIRDVAENGEEAEDWIGHFSARPILTTTALTISTAATTLSTKRRPLPYVAEGGGLVTSASISTRLSHQKFDSASTSSTEESEAITPVTSDTSSYSSSFTPQYFTSIGQFSSLPNTAFTSICSSGKSASNQYDILSSGVVASRPPLLRSASEDVVVNHRGLEILSYDPHPLAIGRTRQAIESVPLSLRSQSSTLASMTSRQVISNLKDKTRYQIPASSLPTKNVGFIDKGISQNKAQKMSSTGNQGDDRGLNTEPESYAGYINSGIHSLSSNISPSHTHRPMSLPSTFDAATAASVRRAAANLWLGTGVNSVLTPSVDLNLDSNPTGSGISCQSGLMGTCGNGDFGNIVRAKVIWRILTQFLRKKTDVQLCHSGC